MNIKHTPESQATDAELNAAVESSSPDSTSPRGLGERWLQRAEEYQDVALDRADPLLALLGALNGDLFVIAKQVGAIIQQDLADHPTVDAVYNLGPIAGFHSNLIREIRGFTDLELRETQAQREVESLQAKRKLMAQEKQPASAAARRIGVAPNPLRGW